MAARLRVLEGPDRGKVFEISSLPAVIGRAKENQVPLTCRSVSRQHAKLDQDERGFILNDVGSSYGIRVGQNTSSAVRLSHGVSFSLGDTTMVFEAPGSAGHAASAMSDTRELGAIPPVGGGSYETTADIETTAQIPSVNIPDPAANSGKNLVLWVVVVLLVGAMVAVAVYMSQQQGAGMTPPPPIP